MQKSRLFSGLLMSTALVSGAASAETLVFGTGNPQGSEPNTYLIEPWIEKVQAAAGDTFTIIQRDGATLIDSANAPDRVADGIVDISWTMTVFNPGRFKRSLVATTPFHELTAAEVAYNFCVMYEEGAFADEYDAFQPLYFIPFSQTYLHLVEGELASLDDLSGMKVALDNPPISLFLDGYNATSLSIPLFDQYQAMQRGTIDATVMNYTGFDAFNFGEVTDATYELPLGSAIGMAFMDKARYEALPDEVRAILDANSGCDQSRDIGARVDEWAANVRAELEAQEGYVVTKLSADEIAEVRAEYLPGVMGMFSGFAADVGGEALVTRWVELADKSIADR